MIFVKITINFLLFSYIMFIYQPNVAIIPGQTLARLLSKHNLSQKELALKTGLTEKHISNIIQGKASITEETAIKLEYVFGGAANFWINLQKNYDEDVARLAFEGQIEKEWPLLKSFPAKELAIYGFISKAKERTEKLKELLKFFGVPSLKLIIKAQAVAYRKTAVKGKKIDQNAVAAWLRIGEIKYEKITEKSEIPTYNESTFRKSLSEIKKLTRQSDFFEKLSEILLKNGVILIDSPYLPKTFISGALRWIGGHPIIQLNDHLKAQDGLYFSLFHEFGHMILHDKRAEYVDYEDKDGKENIEKDADTWACDNLISPKDYQRFLGKKDISCHSIEKFSEDLGVNKDIVVGRLAHDGKIRWEDRARLVGKVDYSA